MKGGRRMNKPKIKRMCIYFKDPMVVDTIESQNNKSEYVERAVRFYIMEKDTIAKLTDTISALVKK